MARSPLFVFVLRGRPSSSSDRRTVSFILNPAADGEKSGCAAAARKKAKSRRTEDQKDRKAKGQKRENTDKRLTLDAIFLFVLVVFCPFDLGS
jgi:hypothetical protein